ncbi:MAG: PQQ-binding-like beta-propeller repeat protein, partial [Planctomycetota bacterium]
MSSAPKPAPVPQQMVEAETPQIDEELQPAVAASTLEDREPAASETKVEATIVVQASSEFPTPVAATAADAATPVSAPASPATPASAAPAEMPTPESLYRETGVRGGLVVHLGCGDGRTTATLRTGDAYLVCGLDRDADAIAAARKYLVSQKLNGSITADRLTGDSLPFIENSVNLIVAEDPSGIPMEEINRVLVPEGVAYVNQGGRWQKSIKPRPQEIDEWTHYLHNPSNNAVAQDEAIEPLGHLQWVGGNRWSRHHDHMSSSSAMVSAGGRSFYIYDQATALSIQIPSHFMLTARDAFNGKVLWERPIDRWHTQMWKLKSGPAALPRRLVAIDDTVYVTLSIDAPVSALNAATGETIRSYAGTNNTEEILYSEGILYLVVNPSPASLPAIPENDDYNFYASPRQLVAVNAETGKQLYRKPARWIAPLTLTVDDGRVLYFDGERIQCVDSATGDPKWQSEVLGKREFVPSYYGPNLVSYDGVILFCGVDPGQEDYHMDNGQTLYGLDAESGKTLWKSAHPASGYRSPEDVLVVNNLVWSADIFESQGTGVFTGRDLRTGEVRVEFPPDVKTHWFHHRCYRAKATSKYLLTSRTGIEFVDPSTKHWTCHHWVRGACLYGIMPANGMIYNMPHPCACYLEAKMYGFNALAPKTASRAIPRDIPNAGRLEQGPAFGRTIAAAAPADDWPTYRHDFERSGFTPAAVQPRLNQAWQTELGGKLTSLVMGAGKVLVASVDTHTVHALDAVSGAPAWQFTAGGRVDSPPTIYEGRVYFGSNDGYVYCLAASDGELVWRFRAAPIDRRMVAYDQVESVWPVHGSILIEDGVLWCVTGRSLFLDGGLRVLRLNPAYGEKISENVIDDRDPDSGQNLQVRLKGLNMPVALTDILLSDGDHVYMRSQQFDKEGNRLALDTPTGKIGEQKGEAAHLFCPTGFLDDTYWHRSYWLYGVRWASGAGGYFQAGRYAPSGRLLVFDDTTIYGFSRKPEYFRWTTPLERQLFAAAKSPEIVSLDGATASPSAAQGKTGAKGGKGKQTAKADKKAPQKKKSNLGGLPEVRVAHTWDQAVPLHVRAMVLAGETLFIAGPPDMIDEVDTLKEFDSSQRKILAQEAAWQGEHGAKFLAVNAATGRTIAEMPLKSLPVFDGMIAAAG